MTKYLLFVLVSGLVFAAGIPTNSIQGDYIEARTADVVNGPCFANSEAGLVGELAVFGWKVNKGAWQGVSLDGLSVVAAVRASATLGDVYHSVYPVKAVLIVDERATPEQRLALRGFAQRMGGDLLQDVVRVDYQPISLDFDGGDIHSMKATLTAGSLARIQTRAIHASDHLCPNVELWYQPLTKVNHSMPVFALAHSFQGQGLGATWSSPDKRSSFVGSFVTPAE
ncbi:MAG: DUF1326 domain-containing protein [Acidobacteria bacterium]|nr:DUF1326 domain-containing protein [Acidobacteriota bacterium]